MGAPNPAADEVISYTNCHSERHSIVIAVECQILHFVQDDSACHSEPQPLCHSDRHSIVIARSFSDEAI
jgi:hypothetical protein